MRSPLLSRWMLIPLIVALSAVTVAGVQASPAAQAPTRIISVDGYVDISGSGGLACPGCNLVFDAADRDASKLDPLPSFTIIVRDSADQELTRGTSTLTSGASATLQQLQLTVPEAAEYRVVLDAAPNGWQLCPNQQGTRTLTENDFTIGRALVSYFFWKGCAGQPTATATSTTLPGPTVTTGPGTATVTPGPTKEPEKPTAVPSGGGEKERPALGAIHGLAFIDLNQDGKLGPDEPGLNDVEVHLNGGGLQISQITPGTGQYSFDGLGQGEYDVYIDPGPEWRVTTPKKYLVSVTGGTVMGYDFGLVRTGEAPVTAPPAAGTGIRLPATGIAAMSPGHLFGATAILLGLLALVGLSTERSRRRG